MLQINQEHRIHGIAQKEMSASTGDNLEISVARVKVGFAAAAELSIYGQYQPEVYVSIATYHDTRVDLD